MLRSEKPATKSAGATEPPAPRPTRPEPSAVVAVVGDRRTEDPDSRDERDHAAEDEVVQAARAEDDSEEDRGDQCAAELGKLKQPQMHRREQ